MQIRSGNATAAARGGAAEFLKHDFRKARLEDIVRAADVTTGPLYWHFRDKEDLFGAIVSAYLLGRAAGASQTGRSVN